MDTANIIPVKDNKSTDSVAAIQQRSLEKIIGARIRLLFDKPFFGNLATRLRLIEVNDKRIPTAATNGRDIMYNVNFIETLTEEQVRFLFGHEVLHVVLDHMGRTNGRNPVIANYAQDYVINLMLSDEKVGEFIPGGCLDTKYRDMNWEQVYDLLYKDATSSFTKKHKLLDTHINETGACDSSNGTTPGNEPGNALSEGTGIARDGSGQTFNVDDLLNISEAEMQEIRDAARDALLQAAAVSKNAGDMPAGIQRLIDDMIKPRVNWKDFLRDQIQSMVRSDYSFLRHSRRTHGMRGIVMPGTIPESTIDVAIAIDMSGSIGLEDASAFLAEIRGMVEQFTDYKIQIWSFDTEVYGHETYTPDSAESIEDYIPLGGGGTDFDVNFQFMKDNDINVKKFIMFTDGYPCGSWGDPDLVDTIFVVKGNTSAESPFGQCVIYEELAN